MTGMVELLSDEGELVPTDEDHAAANVWIEASEAAANARCGAGKKPFTWAANLVILSDRRTASNFALDRVTDQVEALFSILQNSINPSRRAFCKRQP